MIRPYLNTLVDGISLTEKEAEEAMHIIMDGNATPAQIGAFLTALRMKGETVEEITGCARAMREKAAPIAVEGADLVDTCGTGGDRLNTFNISTTTAFVVAGAGARVAKHGNRSVSSRSGSADVLLALGIPVESSPELMADAIREVGIGFLFAPVYHGAMKHAAAARKEIGFRTLFNLLGPLTNPAGASAQVVGVYDGALVDRIALVLLKLGVRHCFVVHGADGLDEISITGKTRIAEGKDGVVSTYDVEPGDFGITVSTLEHIRGGDPDENARILEQILQGRPGPQRDIVLLNAAPALVAAGKAATLEEGAALAARAIDTGAAEGKLSALRNFLRR